MSDEHEVDHYREALQQQALQQQVLEQQVLEQQALEQQALRQQALQQQQLDQQHLSGQYYNAPPSSLPQHYLQELNRYWAEVTKEIEQTKQFKTHKLPLARIKKIMKSDEDVRMISAEAPILFAKACEMFIIELTIRSWLHTEESKRRTLQRSDIATAISKTDIFDFLIDIVPREDGKPVKKDMSGRTMMTPQELANQQYLIFMAQQQALQQQDMGGDDMDPEQQALMQQQQEYYQQQLLQQQALQQQMMEQEMHQQQQHDDYQQ